MKIRNEGGHAVVGGRNYGQGSSREHAALAPRYLGLRVVIAKEFARIHEQNLVNFGILPLTFGHGSDYKGMKQGDVLRFSNLRQQVRAGHMIEVENVTQKQNFKTHHSLSERQIEILLSGGLINRVKRGLKR